jgi:hypothetical protein
MQVVLVLATSSNAFDIACTSPLDVSNWFYELMNECTMDTHKINIMGSFGLQIATWFSVCANQPPTTMVA